MFHLEKYRGAKTRYTCPACGARRSYTRYINSDTGENLSDEVGRCNHESKCGYHFTPKEYFAVNLGAEGFQSETRRSFRNSNNPYTPTRVSENMQPDYIDFKVFQKTLANYENNSFVQFLFDQFPNMAESILFAVKNYFIGTTRDGKTVFWQIDKMKRIRTGKIIAYDAATGKRRKDIFPTWAHSELKRGGRIKEDFNLMQCFFGEHLFSDGRPLAIVEAEKTAVIASIFFPEFVWLAAGARLNLKMERLRELRSQQIILYPDGDSYSIWLEKAHEAISLGMKVNVSSLIETYATDEQKVQGYDLADFLIDNQSPRSELN